MSANQSNQGNQNNANQGNQSDSPKPTIPDEEGQPDCPVCLSRVQNRSYTNSCLHEFCYDCIKEWSRTHNRCPVCREVYRKILHNIRSKTDYDEEEVAEPLNPENGVLLQMGGITLIIAPQNSALFVINPVRSRTGTVRHNVLQIGPGQSLILNNSTNNMVITSPDRLEATLTEMGARPHYRHHGRHPRFRHRRHAQRSRSP